ncbi:MAG: hypothetical protein D6736_15095 [Nitrospinota bacterium]|nr:MAG: hypothetical protein D6736_15095 [Nitrospinota bacterium]
MTPRGRQILTGKEFLAKKESTWYKSLKRIWGGGPANQIKVVIVAVIALLVIVVILQNTQPVETRP